MTLNRLGLYAIRLVRAVALGLAITLLAALFGGTQLLAEVRQDLEASLPDIDALDRPGHSGITKILSRDGRLVATLFKEKSRPVPYQSMGNNIVQAVTAIEDERYFQHSGVDYKGIARAAYQNYRSGEIRQGASTITMQLARHLYLSDERSYERKVKEALLALKMEERYSKEEILGRYLNEVYFGAGAHGIAAASSRYFSKEPAALSPAEAAMLAALVQSPTHFNPIVNHAGAKKRQAEVLRKMWEQGHLDREQYAAALTEAAQQSFDHLEPGQGRPLLKYPYFTTYAVRQLAQRVGERALYNDGLTISTTLDLEAQRHTERVITEQIRTQGRRINADSAAAVLIENRSGHILAMVGGAGWSDRSQFNTAWQGRRQPGSCFKPLLYAAALEQGATQDTILDDSEIEIETDGPSGSWSPSNCDGRERGEIPLREALRLSRNQATVDLLTRTGLSPLLMFAEKAGIDRDLPRVPSLALGAAGVSPLEMAEAYSVFANGGVHQDPACFTEIKDAQGRVVSRGTRWSDLATSPRVAAQMTDLMRRVVEDGTGQAARVSGLQTAGKTGTTDSYKDAWFVGYSPKYTLAVWVGNQDNSPTWRVYGGDLPARIWSKIMAGLDHQGETKFSFLREKPLTRVYCKNSHRVATEECKKTYRAQFYVQPPATDDCEQCQKRQRLFLEQFEDGSEVEIPMNEILPTLDSQDYDPGADVFDQATSYPRA